MLLKFDIEKRGFIMERIFKMNNGPGVVLAGRGTNELLKLRDIARETIKLAGYECLELDLNSDRRSAVPTAKNYAQV